MTSNITSSLTARLRFEAEGVVFNAVQEYMTLESLTIALQKLKARFNDDLDIETVLFYFESDRCLDEHSVDALMPIIQTLGVAPEHCANESGEPFDPYDVGVVSPDGTVRLVWHKEISKSSIEHSFEVLNRNITRLLEIQEKTI